jgi:hypothetical protein
MRKTHKTPAQLEAILLELYGTLYGSQRKLAAEIGRHEVSVSRYCTGDSPVDLTTSKMIDAVLEKHRRKHKRQPAVARVVNINDMF